MNTLTLAKREIKNPIHDKLEAISRRAASSPSDPASLKHGDLLVIDCPSCSAEDIRKAFPALDAGACVLLLDPTQADKEVLAKHIGLRTAGSARGYLVTRRTAPNGRKECHIWELGDTVGQVALQMSGRSRQDASPTVCPPIFATNVHEVSPRDIDSFVKTLEGALDKPLVLDDTSQPAPVSHTWTVSLSHSQTVASSNVFSGLGPPPDGYVSLNGTYVVNAALNNEDESGAFQWVGCTFTGILTGGLSSDTGESFGWFLANHNPSLTAPSELFYYSSSPPTTNNATTVTTGTSVTVGFTTTGGVSTTCTYSNSATNNIYDWAVTQTSGSSWNYYQATPFNGNSTDNGTIDNCIDWAHGNGVQTSEFPAISTSSLQFAVETVWKTNSVLTDTITLYGQSRSMVDYIMTQVILGATNKEASWWYNVTWPQDALQLDMSQVT